MLGRNNQDNSVSTVRNASENQETEAIQELIATGSEVAGGLAGSAIGLFVAGPPGALIGGAAAPLFTRTFRKVAVEVKSRFLGPREEVRIGGVLAFAAKRIEENLSKGQQVRQDGFFDTPPRDRAAAEEIVEGILLAAQREHQEKKLQFYGNLVANVAFHPEIDRTQANLLLKLAERVTYSQMCLLAIFAQKEMFSLRQEGLRSTAGNIATATIAVIQETYDLYSQGMLNSSGVALLSLADVTAGKMNVQGMGSVLYELMELEKIDRQDLEVIAGLLQ